LISTTRLRSATDKSDKFMATRVRRARVDVKQGNHR
jgi:hypothetical protein